MGTERQTASILHFSQLLGILIPALGYIAPLVIWLSQKEKYPEIDADGKVIANFMITQLVLMAVGAATACIGVGVAILLYAAVVGIIFPIIGGMKASDGIVWKYPLTFAFLK